MTEDPTRATPRQADQETPAHGWVGPADPHADPATDPALRPVEGTVPGRSDDPTVPTATEPTSTGPERGEPRVTRTRTGGLWTGLILSAIVLIFLLIFILQNNVPVRITFLGLSGTLPAGVALLLAAIAGLLLVAIPGGVRILQLRRAARHGTRRSG
jgi:uncharacterized integral membrane protein